MLPNNSPTLCEGAETQGELVAQRGLWAQPKRYSPCPPCLSSFNTEPTEPLSDLRVEALLTTEHTEATPSRRANKSGTSGTELFFESAALIYLPQAGLAFTVVQKRLDGRRRFIVSCCRPGFMGGPEG
jgi:hypothetical protein